MLSTLKEPQGIKLLQILYVEHESLFSVLSARVKQQVIKYSLAYNAGRIDQLVEIGAKYL